MKRPDDNPEESVKTFLDSFGNPPQATIEEARGRLIERFRAGDQLPAFEEETPRRRRNPWVMAAVAASLLAVVGIAGVVVFRGPSGPVVEIAENQAKVVTLGDGSRLNMRPGTELSYYRESGGRCIQLVRGDVDVNAAKQEAGQQLCVQTKDITVTVVGTLFTVRVEEKGSSVVVQEGTVWVQQGSTKKTLMAGGRFSTIVAEPEAKLHVSVLTPAPPAQVPTQAREPAKPAPPQFDVISIRKTTPQQFVRNGVSPGGYRANMTTLRAMVLLAYGLERFQVSGGPAWMDTDLFAVEANIPRDVGTKFQRAIETGSAEEQIQARSTFEPMFRSMMQDMLATRFKLRVRRTTEQASAYALVLNGKDSKLQVSSELEGFEVSGPHLTGAITMARLAQFVSGRLGQPVVDRTGLPGVYDVKLEFLSDATREALLARGGAAPGGGGRGDGAGARAGGNLLDDPDLPTALREQLGLKLETTKAPVEFLVIERVEQPSEN